MRNGTPFYSRERDKVSEHVCIYEGNGKQSSIESRLIVTLLVRFFFSLRPFFLFYIAHIFMFRILDKASQKKYLFVSSFCLVYLIGQFKRLLKTVVQ